MGLVTLIHSQILWVTLLLTMGGVLLQNGRLCSGGVPEWPKGSDCKSDGSAFAGSNPAPSSFAGVVQW